MNRTHYFLLESRENIFHIQMNEPNFASICEEDSELKIIQFYGNSYDSSTSAEFVRFVDVDDDLIRHFRHKFEP